MDRRVFSCALAVAAALFAHAAGAQNLLCTGAVEDRRVNGNLTAVGVCELDDVEVRGNVRVPDGASLFASDVRIGGNLIVDRALAVDVSSSEINGNLTVEELAGFESEVTGTEVGGNVVLERNRTRVNLVGNEIRGKVTVVLNTGGVELTANTIGGRLECERNDPAPLVFENVVDDGARGQCASLSPPPSPSPEPAPPTQPPQQPPVTPGPPSPAPSPSPLPIPSPSPSPAPPSVPETTSSFVPQPEGGGGGAVGALEIGLLPLLLLGRLRRLFGPYNRRAAG